MEFETGVIAGAPATVRTDSGISCEIVTDFARLEELSFDWRRLVSRDAWAGVFQHWEWARAFCVAYEEKVSLRVVIVFRGADVAGILPLMARGRRLEFLGSPESDYNDLIRGPAAGSAVLEAALDCLLGADAPEGWDCLALTNLPQDSHIVSECATLPPSLRRRVQLLPHTQSPTIVLDGNQSQALHALLRKQQIKRSEKKLSKLGRVAFRRLESREAAREHLENFFRQHIARCAMSGGRSQFLSPHRRAFYHALVEQCDLRSSVRFAALELDGRPVAYHFGLQSNGRFIWYKPAFDVDYWDFSPGDVLLGQLFRYAGEADVREFDFSIGDEPFKFRFANQVKQNYALYIERRPGSLRSRAQAAIRSAKAAARQNPQLRRLFNAGVRVADEVVCSLQRARGGLGFRRTKLLRNPPAIGAAFVYSSTAGPPGGREPDPVVPATLSRFAELSLEHSPGLSTVELAECRHRLKHGEEAFIGREENGESVVFWISTKAEPRALREYWMAKSGGTPSAALFRGLAMACPGKLWIHCPRHRRKLREAVAAAGFQLQ